METYRILLVEDDVLIADLLQLMIEDAGHSVELVTDADAAEMVLVADDHSIDVLITDIRLPGADGWTLARRARQLRPEIPTIYITGQGTHDWPAKGVAESILLEKPFAASRVLDALSSLTQRLKHVGGAEKSTDAKPHLTEK
ncbi:MAG: response regulator [Sphingobium sp.]